MMHVHLKHCVARQQALLGLVPRSSGRMLFALRLRLGRWLITCGQTLLAQATPTRLESLPEFSR